MEVIKLEKYYVTSQVVRQDLVANFLQTSEGRNLTSEGRNLTPLRTYRLWGDELV